MRWPTTGSVRLLASRRPDLAGFHEIKHDGFRIPAHRGGRSVRLLTRNGNDLGDRFPLAAAAIEELPVKSCVIDGEAIVCDDNGLAVFDLIRGHGTNARAVLCAFDLLEVNGEDIRREAIEDRKRRLAGLLRLPHDGIAINEHFGGDGAIIYPGPRQHHQHGTLHGHVAGAVQGYLALVKDQFICGARAPINQ